MKYVINAYFGGFALNQEMAKMLGVSAHDDSKDVRTDERLISAIERGEDVGASYSKLEVVDIPDDRTDWELDEYDGMESIIYVKDGKIHHLY